MTECPDVGLHLFDISDGPSTPEFLCRSGSSNVGDHWNIGHCPYDDGPIEVYAPQHTHPHPSFSPNAERIVFTSDATGHSQVYEASLRVG